MRTKFFLLLLSVYLTNFNVYARNYVVSELPIVVRYITEWTADYPTVINNWNGMFVEKVNGNMPPIMSVVVSINGQDTKGMKEDVFNDILMSKTECQLTYLQKEKGANVEKKCTLSYNNQIYWAEGVTLFYPASFTDDFKLRNDKRMHAFDYCKYSFQTGNVEELDEISILRAAGKAFNTLGYDESEDGNSDIILALAKGKDEYNGQTITLHVLDGEKLRKGENHILWSITLSGLNNVLKSNEGTIKTLLNRNCTIFPFDVPTYSMSMETLGVAFKSKADVSSGRILKVLPHSDAYEKGLRGGDVIYAAYTGMNDFNLYAKTRHYYFKANKKEHAKNWGMDLLLFLPLIPSITYNNAEHYLVDGKNHGSEYANNHFRVKKRNGYKEKMLAPFYKHTFTFKYIR